jgi:hypothetical protein
MLRKKNFLVVTILILLVFLVTGCSGFLPKPTKGVISGRVLIPPTAKQLSKDISGWVGAAGAEVTIVDANGVKHTVITDENGYYNFENIAVKANTVVTATVKVDGKTMVLKTVIDKAVGKEQKHDSGAMTPESTALALVVEQLIAEGAPVDLDEIRATGSYAELLGRVAEILEGHGNVTEDPDVTEAVGETSEEVITPPTPPAPTPPSSPTVAVVASVSIVTEPVDVSDLDNDAEVKVTLSTETSGAEIYYTTDGSTPTKSSILYDESFTITTPGVSGGIITIKAVGIKSGYKNSAIATKDIAFKEKTKPGFNKISNELGISIISIEAQEQTSLVLENIRNFPMSGLLRRGVNRIMVGWDVQPGEGLGCPPGSTDVGQNIDCGTITQIWPSGVDEQDFFYNTIYIIEVKLDENTADEEDVEITFGEVIDLNGNLIEDFSDIQSSYDSTGGFFYWGDRYVGVILDGRMSDSPYDGTLFTPLSITLKKPGTFTFSIYWAELEIEQQDVRGVVI